MIYVIIKIVNHLMIKKNDIFGGMKMELSENIAFELHEEWRKTRLKEDGSYDPRWKAIKDKEFASKLEGQVLPSYIRKNETGVYEIDIANAHYNQLSPDWQAENKAAGKVVAQIIESGKRLTRSQVGNIIHNAWLERNAWAKDGELGVPFDKLPKNEQDKDIAQFEVALKVYEAESVAYQLHEEWRKTRLKEDGSYDPRWKAIKDKEFASKLNDSNLPKYIRKNEAGAYEMDIANAHYNQLSPDWQAENKAAGRVVAVIVLSGKQLTRSQVGNIIHNAWLERNAWAKDGELGVPFDKLSKNEQDKDIAQYDVAVKAHELIQNKVGMLNKDTGKE
jgi:hypothetical protein